MFARQLQDALVQVRQLQHAVLDRQRFKGYSGPARAISGCLALFVAVAMSTRYVPETTRAHILGWGGLFAAASLLNFGALVYWYVNDPTVRRDFRKLRPLLDVIPPLFVGAALTFTFILHGLHQYLFGVWMCTFGLSNMASRYVLPRMISVVGAFYIVAGVFCLVAPGIRFLNPLPMGIVFFAGELASGMVLHIDNRRLLDEELDLSTGEEDG